MVLISVLLCLLCLIFTKLIVYLILVKMSWMKRHKLKYERLYILFLIKQSLKANLYIGKINIKLILTNESYFYKETECKINIVFYNLIYNLTLIKGYF